MRKLDITCNLRLKKKIESSWIQHSKMPLRQRQKFIEEN